MLNLKINKLLPNFYGVMETKHYSKGRLRFKINLLKQDDEATSYLEETLAQIEAITTFRVNKQIGTLLLIFDESQVAPLLLSGVIIKILNLETEIEAKKDGKLSKSFNQFISNIDKGIYNKSKGLLDKKVIVSGVLLYFAFKQFRQNKKLPNGSNLIWWAYNLITK